MQDIKSILTICIPTYNRGTLLEQSIIKMIPLCLENNIQICVSDNASPDETPAVMTKLAGKYSFINYHRHRENIGPDDNFEFVLKMADTKYRWLMSDTCYVDDIGDLIQDLEAGDWDGYILGSPGDRGEKLPKEKKTYSESISLMSDIGWHLTWISCMIYHQRLVDSFDFLRYKNSCFNQTALMFEPTANRECNICFNPGVAVKNLPLDKESGWHYHVFEVMYKKWFMLVMSLPLYYPYEVKMKCYKDSAKYALPLQLYSHARRKADGKWKYQDLYKNRFFVKQSSTNYCVLSLIGMCPPIMMKFVFWGGHYINIVLRFIRMIK